MGGIQNLPYSQTDRVDPQDNILKRYVIWLGPHHLIYNRFLSDNHEGDITFNVVMGGKSAPTQGARAVSAAPQAFPSPIGLS